MLVAFSCHYSGQDSFTCCFSQGIISISRSRFADVKWTIQVALKMTGSLWSGMNAHCRAPWLPTALAPFAGWVRALCPALPNMQQRKTAWRTIIWQPVCILCINHLWGTRSYVHIIRETMAHSVYSGPTSHVCLFYLWNTIITTLAYLFCFLKPVFLVIIACAISTI